MSAQHTAHQLDGLTTGILMSMMIAGERGRIRAAERRDQAQAIAAHNASVARARAARRQRAAIVAEQIRIGEQRMSRWLDRVAH